MIIGSDRTVVSPRGSTGEGNYQDDEEWRKESKGWEGKGSALIVVLVPHSKTGVR
jgi:hypothetical protein